MPRAPDQLTLGRHRDLHGRENRAYIRWALLSLLGVVCLLGLLNAFGQRPHTRTGSDSASSSGRVAEASPQRPLLHVALHDPRERELESATLVLDSGWLERITPPGPCWSVARSR